LVKSIRIDSLPEEIQRQIMALRDGATGGGTGVVTAQQVERALSALENGLPSHPSTTGKGWATTNHAIAMGRVALRFFAENPTAKKQFKNYLGKLQSSGRVVTRGKSNGHSEVTT
jgi:hypothetical protein